MDVEDTERSCQKRRRARGRWRRLLAAAVLLGCAGSLPDAHAAGRPTFGPPVQYAAGDGIRALTADDFDADGFADVLVRDPSGRVTIHRGDGRGALIGIRAVPGEAPAEVADVDGQGARDLFDVVQHDAHVLTRARLSDAAGGFAPPVVSDVLVSVDRLQGFETGAFDGDPGTDLVLLLGGDGARGSALWLASGRGDGGFAAARPAGSTSDATDLLALPDLNADGRQEVATTDSDGNLRVSRSDPSGGFAIAEPRRVGVPGSMLGPMAVGRFARGGPPAVAVADPVRSCIAIVSLTLDRGAPAVPCYPSSGRVESLTAADLTGDGTTELLHGRSGGGVVLLRARRGGLGRARIVDIGRASYSSDPLTPDLDGDGRVDVVVVANLRSLATLRNVGRRAEGPVSSAS